MVTKYEDTAVKGKEYLCDTCHSSQKLTYLAEGSALPGLMGERGSTNGRIGIPDTNNQMQERAAAASYLVVTGMERVSIHFETRDATSKLKSVAKQLAVLNYYFLNSIKN